MQEEASSKTNKQWLQFLLWVGITILFVLAFGGFRIMLSGNQTTKMLFGYANSGWGYLADDWFANTKDPLPLFSWLVELILRTTGSWGFDLVQFILMGIFIFSIFGIVDHVFDLRSNKWAAFTFMVLYLASFSPLWPIDLELSLHDGVAGQFIGFKQLLPNSFGALFLLSIYLFLKDKPVGAILAIGVGSSFHSGYLVIGAALTLAYIFMDYLAHKDFKRVLMIGGGALLLVLPITIHYYLGNTNATSEQINQAKNLVVNLRIPQHTLVHTWWGPDAFFKLIVLLVGLVVAALKKSKLVPIMLIFIAVIFGPALVTYIRPSNTIAMLQLWRTSVVAVPIAVAVILANFVSSIYQKEHPPLVNYLIAGMMVVLLIAVTGKGIHSQIDNVQNAHQIEEDDLYEYVRQTGQQGDNYLVPVYGAPKLFTFRLSTGMPIVVNWKSHPWNAVEMLEWDQRRLMAHKFYRLDGEEKCEQLNYLVDTYQVTHVVALNGRAFDCPNTTLTYEDNFYLLYKVRP